MAVQLTIPYQTLLELVDQLSEDQKRELINHLQEQAKQRKLSPEEWRALFESAVITTPISPDFSFNRADWYDDDGR